MKFAGVIYLPTQTGDCFSPSSLKTLVSCVPSVLCSKTILTTSNFFHSNRPPWNIKPLISSVLEALFPLLQRSVVASHSEHVLSVYNSTLTHSTFYRRTTRAARAKIVGLIHSLRHSFKYFIFSFLVRLPHAFLCPNVKISSVESLLLLSILNLDNSFHLLLSANSLSTSFQLAKLWAAQSDEKTDSLTSGPYSERSPIVKHISDSLYKCWKEEGVSSLKGLATNLFFPTTSSASVLLKILPSVGV